VSVSVSTSPAQSHLGRAISPPSCQRMDSPTACASCIMPTADKSGTQPLIRVVTYTPHKWACDDSIYHASIVSRDRNTPNSNLANILSYIAIKVICEELHSYLSCKEWTCLLCVLLTAQCPLHPITQPRVCYIHTTVPHSS